MQHGITTLADNYNGEAIFIFSKMYVKDGFWRLEVSDTDAWNFCYILLQYHNVKYIDDIKLVAPNCLQM